MALYRFYWFGSDDHIKSAENVECASDDEAQAKARQLIGSYAAIEVWLGTRCVVRLTGRDTPG